MTKTIPANQAVLNRLKTNVAISLNDIDCYANDFRMIANQFCLLGQAMDLLRQHKDDLTAFETLTELIQQACWNMANNAESNKKEMLELLPSDQRQSE